MRFSKTRKSTTSTSTTLTFQREQSADSLVARSRTLKAPVLHDQRWCWSCIVLPVLRRRPHSIRGGGRSTTPPGGCDGARAAAGAPCETCSSWSLTCWHPSGIVLPDAPAPVQHATERNPPGSSGEAGNHCCPVDCPGDHRRTGCTLRASQRSCARAPGRSIARRGPGAAKRLQVRRAGDAAGLAIHSRGSKAEL